MIDSVEILLSNRRTFLNYLAQRHHPGGLHEDLRRAQLHELHVSNWDGTVMSRGDARYTAQEDAMEKDVICGMQVDPAKAAGTSQYNGKTYYFCSKGCKAKFDAHPAQYAK